MPSPFLLALLLLAPPGVNPSESEVGYAVPRKGPYLADLDQTTAEVRWEVDAGTDTALTLGTGGVAIPVEIVDGMARARLAGLHPDTRYAYVVRLGTSPTRVQHFQTLPEPGSPVSFVVFGDTRTNHAIHARLAARMASEAPDFAVNTGDLVSNGTVEDHWQPFFEAERALFALAPMFPAVGNHDARGLFNESFYERYFATPRYYEKRAGAVTLFFVDTTQSYASGSAQHAWLEDRLAAARARIAKGSREFLIAVHHHPAWSSGHHGNEAGAQRELVPLYQRYGVTAVLSGHDHLYERLESEGVTYFVSGGGGAPLYESKGLPETRSRHKTNHYLRVDADGEQMRVRAIDLDGNVLDDALLKPGVPHEPAPVASALPLAGAAGVFLLAALASWFTSARFA